MATFGIAAVLEGRRFVGCESVAQYATDAAARIRAAAGEYVAASEQMALGDLVGEP